jgi:S-adenosylmethionine decarboxylase proenzyme
LKASGRHLLAEYHGCDREILNDREQVERLLRAAAEAARATVVGAVFHRFSPQGVSGVVVIEESHLSVHTWPEHGYAAVDFFTCGECTPEKAHEVIERGLRATRSETMLVNRGLLGAPRSMEVTRHESSETGGIGQITSAGGARRPFRTA